MSDDTLEMVEGAIEVAELTVADVMVPRAQMVSLPIDAPLPEVLAAVIESGHSRFPVHGDDRDTILGILLAKDLLRCYADSPPPAGIRGLLRPATLIPESKRLDILLKEFRLSRHHMAIVVDEYGGVGGLVTIEDVLEQIVGDIDDEHDDDDAAKLIQTDTDGRFLVNALTPIGDFNDRFGSSFSDDEYDTVGGMVTARMGHLPEVGDEAELAGFRFRVTRADARRVQQFAVRTHDA
jgi:magnesium and cobalt transporter